MTQSMGMRTTSLAASAALMGAIVFAAFTMSVTFIPRIGEMIEPPIVDMAELPPPAPPVRPPRNTTPPIERPIEGPTSVQPLPPMNSEITETGPAIIGPSQPETITRPSWVRVPSDLQRYYPRRALERGMEGDVLLDCLVSTSGNLQCSVASETPASWGFAEAALRISRDYQMVPAMRGGQAVEGRYRMRVPFRVD